RLLDVSLTIYPVRDEAGQILGLAATTRDITRRKRYAAALAASERRFRTAFDDAPNGMALMDLDGRLIQVNRAGCELLGYTEQQMKQRTAFELAHPDDAARIAATRISTIERGGRTYSQEMRMWHRDGSERLIRLQSSLVRDVDGQPAYFIVQAQDLTDSVVAREKLTAVRTQMQAVLERVGGAFIEVDADWRITEANATAGDLLGLPRDALTGAVLHEVMDPELLAPMQEALRVTMDERRRAHVAEFAYAPRSAWFTLRAYPTVEGASLFIRDISTLRHLEQELRVAEMRFQALVEQLPAVVYMHANDASETMIYLSPYFEVLTGLSIEKDAPCQTFEDWLGLIHPDDRERVLREGLAYNQERNQVVLEYRFRRADGSYIWVSDIYAAMFDDAGQIIAWQGIMLDITSRIEARNAIAQLAAIVEASDDAIFTRTLDGHITYWNPAAERLYGYSAGEAIGQSLLMLFPVPEDPEAPRLSIDMFRIDAPERFVATQRRKDGTLFEVSITRFPIRSRNGEIVGTSGIARDISDRIAAERKLRAALDTAESAVRTKGLFLAMMSHELRTPLQAVLGYADFLLGGRQGALTAAQLEDVHYIHQGASRMVSLIEQLLDLSRMEAGRLDLKQEAVDVRHVLEQVRQDVAPQAEAKGLQLSVRAPGRLARALGDGDRVRQIVLNLAGNAVKFTEAGEVRISARTRADWVEVAVKDTGEGIAADEQDAIFEEFRQVDSNLSRPYGGAGLGLAIARRLAEQMGGGIAVTSTLGKGSTFTLRLPSARSRGNPGQPGSA
ncbi:MAG: PAS domain S-box protein, partial [Thermomicrobiales bacterium]|nr:PAS domain S-box protein [Thermomicrobiales bacterium]